MEFLITWLSTIIAAYIMNLTLSLRIIKDIADSGYKIDIYKIRELQEQLNSNIVRANKILLLIPLFNIGLILKETSQYFQIQETILDQFRVMDILIEMTNEEQEKYLKKPTGFNALLVSFKSKVEEEMNKPINIEKLENNTIKDIDILEEINQEDKENILDISERKQQLNNLKDELLNQKETNLKESDKTKSKNLKHKK